MSFYEKLSESIFGLGYAGFSVILHQVGEELNVGIVNNIDIKHYKFDILRAVLKEKPFLSASGAIDCIEAMCGEQFFNSAEKGRYLR